MFAQVVENEVLELKIAAAESGAFPVETGDMTVDEQRNAFASAGFTDMTLEEEIGAMILVTGRAAKLSVASHEDAGR